MGELGLLGRFVADAARLAGLVPGAVKDSNFGSDDPMPASAYAGSAGAVTAGATVAEPHSGELDYNGPELAHSAELDYQGADDLSELLPREAAQAPAPRGFARPGDLSAGGGVV